MVPMIIATKYDLQQRMKGRWSSSGQIDRTQTKDKGIEDAASLRFKS
jgi:hypothetical protein